MSMKKLAIATGNEELNQLLVASLQDDYEVMDVHFRSFLIKHSFDVIITSSMLKGNIEINETLFELKRKGKRIIFLTSLRTSEEIEKCLQLGIFDIMYEDITHKKIIELLKAPNDLKDVAHLLDEFGSKSVKLEESGQNQKVAKKKSFFSLKKKEAEASLIEETPIYLNIKQGNHAKKAQGPTKKQASDCLDKYIDHSLDLFDDQTEVVSQETVENLDKLKGISVPQENWKTAEEPEGSWDNSEKSKKTMSHVKKQVTRKPLGNQIIAISGIRAHVGTTHTALLFAYGLKKSGYKNIALVENGLGAKAFEGLNHYYNDNKGNSVFKIKGIHYFVSLEDLYLRVNEFEVIVIDMGVFGRTHNSAIYKMANKKLLVCDAAAYREHEWISFIKEYGQVARDLTCVLPLSTKEEAREFKIFMELKSVYQLPYDKQVFSPIENTVHTIERVIQ